VKTLPRITSNLFAAIGLLAVGLFVGTAISRAAADPMALTAEARCNGKWVNVTTNALDTDIVVARKEPYRDEPGSDPQWVLTGKSWVTSVGGGYPERDYGLRVDIERRSSSQLTGLDSTSVTLPDCTGTPRTTAPPATADQPAKLVTISDEPKIEGRCP
jgi:hypothetical protein